MFTHPWGPRSESSPRSGQVSLSSGLPQLCVRPLGSLFRPAPWCLCRLPAPTLPSPASASLPTLPTSLYKFYLCSVPGGQSKSTSSKNPFYVPLSRTISSGLPWWRSGWESACQCRGHGFEPWSGKIPHAVEQLGPWATTTEPAHLEPVLRNKRGHDSERPAHRVEEWPPLAATGESPRTETKTQHSQK